MVTYCGSHLVHYMFDNTGRPHQYYGLPMSLIFLEVPFGCDPGRKQESLPTSPLYTYKSFFSCQLNSHSSSAAANFIPKASELFWQPSFSNESGNYLFMAINNIHVLVQRWYGYHAGPWYREQPDQRTLTTFTSFSYHEYESLMRYGICRYTSPGEGVFP